MDESQLRTAGAHHPVRARIGLSHGREKRCRGALQRLACVLVVAGVVTLAPRAHAQGVLENPQPGSAKSGIGVLSGWKCTARRWG